MTAEKVFKTVDEQIAILKERGLKIEDEETAKNFLLRNNYYRISGYSLTLRQNDVFSKTATFQNIMDIYNFDRELRNIILKYIEIIEVTMKSVYAYEFARIYGGTAYVDSSLFTDEKKHKEIMEKANIQKKARLAHEAYLKHYITDLQQELPIWAYVDLLTIADISFLYSISQNDVKLAVATQYGLNLKRGKELLGQFMHSMTIIRNLCAHGSRIYNRLFEQKPSLNKDEKALLIKKEDGTIDNAHFYSFVLIMRRLLSTEEFAAMKREIVNLTTKYPFVAMRYYGFRDDWQETL